MCMTEGEDLGFTYREGKNGQVTIRHRGKLAATLRGDRAAKFLDAATLVRSEVRQQLMARWTGNFKHGNERVAKRHRRGR